MTDSQTPLTDALIGHGWIGEPIEVCRTLERDRAALIAALAYMIDAATVADDREDLPECFDRDVVAEARATLARVKGETP